MKDLVKDYELKGKGSSAGLYVGTYKKYANGSLYGMWVDLEMFTYAEDFFEVCRELHDDEEDPELMFQDFQGFPESMYGESMGEDEIQNILDYLALSDEEREIVEAYCEIHCEELTDIDSLLREAKGRWCGEYSDFKDFAMEQAEEEIAARSLGDKTEWFERFFDYDQYANELRHDYDMSNNGHIFYS